MKMSTIAIKEMMIEKFFFTVAISSLGILLLIMIFLFKEGLPLFSVVSVTDFIFGMEWFPTSGVPRFGVFPIIIGSVSVTILSSLIALPLSLSIAVYLSELATPTVRAVMKPLVEIIASIPSVVIGFFGMVVVAPYLQNQFNIDTGLNLFNASLMLAFMAVPTIASLSEDAISSIPMTLKESSYALGANRWETIRQITLPAARSGIWTAVLLGISRVIGETMVVLMVAGGSAMVPKTVFSPVRPLTSNIAAEMAEAAVGGDHYHALFTIGIILFIITFAFNVVSSNISNRYKIKWN